MSITISAFRDSPDRGRGQARDMRVRWALEEIGQPYDVRLLSFAELKQPDHLTRNPFGSIPTWEDGTATLFESGAILLHMAEQWPGLLPADPAARGLAVSWMFAALNTVEPPIVDRESAGFTARNEHWYPDYLNLADARIRGRLDLLSADLGERDWLAGTFSAADILMVTVLRRAEGMGVLEAHPNLITYIARGMDRPAWQRAYQAQYEVFLAAHSGDRCAP